jgi:hypothetical protein
VNHKKSNTNENNLRDEFVPEEEGNDTTQLVPTNELPPRSLMRSLIEKDLQDLQNENVKLANRKDTDPEQIVKESESDDNEQEIDELAPRQLRKNRAKTVKFNPEIYDLTKKRKMI